MTLYIESIENNRNLPSSLKNLKIEKPLGKGSFNSVYSTSDPNIVVRLSNEQISTDDMIMDYKTESKFNKMSQKKYPGELVDHVFFDNSKTLQVGETAFSFREAFDSDLEKYLEDALEEAYKNGQSENLIQMHLKNATSALEDAVDVFDKLVKIGIMCSDVKPQNFLVKKKKPVGYKGQKKKVYVRMIDLDGQFCTLDPFKNKHDLNLYRDLTVIQLYVMAFDINKTRNVSNSLKKRGARAIAKAAQKEKVCRHIDEIKKIVGKWFVSGRWNNVVETFKWYVGNFDYKEEFCNIAQSPPTRRQSKRQSKRRSKRRSKKACRGKAPVGKICNPKTGRWVFRNGKVGRSLVARASYKSPQRKVRRKKRESPKKKGCASNKVRNPKTGRCVLKRGKIGKRILRGEI